MLSDLIGLIQNFGDAENIFHNEIGNNEIQNPAQNRVKVQSKGITQSIPSEFFERFGIRSLTLNSFQGGLKLSEGIFSKYPLNLFEEKMGFIKVVDESRTVVLPV